jgi:hypothetical protein
MRERDPRQIFRRNRDARARVQLIETPHGSRAEDGAVTTKQVAAVTVPRSELDPIWNAEHLERLARTYWSFLTRVSLGILRVRYSSDSREIVVFTRPFTLLRFHAPEYETGTDKGAVTWRIAKGLLVAPMGRSKGFLRLAVERLPPAAGDSGRLVNLVVSSEVANFYPTIGGWGWFARIGSWLYEQTQLRAHIILTNSFLRSLARLDLAPSVVGALRARAEEARAEGDEEKAQQADAAADSEEVGTGSG